MARVKLSRYGFKVAPEVAVFFRGAEHIYESLKDELGLINKEGLAAVDYTFYIDPKSNDPFSTLHLTVEETTVGGDGRIDTKKVRLKCNPSVADTVQKALKNKTLALQDNEGTSTISWKVIAVAIC